MDLELLFKLYSGRNVHYPDVNMVGVNPKIRDGKEVFGHDSHYVGSYFYSVLNLFLK